MKCADGEIATGGGAAITNVLTGSSLVIASGPLESDATPPEEGDNATGWEAVGVNSDTGQAQVMAVYAHCVKP